MLGLRLPDRLKSCALAFGFWTLLAASYAVSAGLSELAEGRPATWTRMVTWNLTNFWSWMLLVPVIARLGRLTARGGWRRSSSSTPSPAC